MILVTLKHVFHSLENYSQRETKINLEFFSVSAKQANHESSESENEELKNMERKEKKQLHKVKKLITKKKDQVNKSIAKKNKKSKAAA